ILVRPEHLDQLLARMGPAQIVSQARQQHCGTAGFETRYRLLALAYPQPAEQLNLPFCRFRPCQTPILSNLAPPAPPNYKPSNNPKYHGVQTELSRTYHADCLYF